MVRCGSMNGHQMSLECVLKHCKLSIFNGQHILGNLNDDSMSSRISTLITDKIVKR